MKRRLKQFFISATAGILLLGCYPKGPEYVEDLDVVYTTHDPGYDFGSKGSYARPDQIVVDIKDGAPVYMKDAFAVPILAAIDANMAELGYDLVDIEDDPDLILTPAGITSTTYFYSYWYDWWYGGYWGWYYPPYYTISSYTTGSMIMVIAQADTSDLPSDQAPAVWIGVGNGLVSGAYDLSRITKAIDQAFAQSPYLKTN